MQEYYLLHLKKQVKRKTNIKKRKDGKSKTN